MSALVQMGALVLAVIIVIGLLALKRAVLARMASRNIVRRKKYSAIVVLGLMIATAMISSALVVGDTLDYVIRKDVYDSLGNIDIIVSLDDDAGLHQFFDEATAYGLISQLETEGFDHIDDIAPAIRDVTSALHPATGSSVPSAYLFAYDSDHMIDELHGLDGAEITEDLVTGGRTVVNEGLANELDVDVGASIMLYPKNGQPIALEIAAVAADEGMGNWQFAEVAFIDLAFAQDTIFAKPSMITVIDVSCEGSVEKGHLATDGAIDELETAMDDAGIYTFSDVKRDGVEEAATISDMTSQLFVLMSSFTIIAGVALIVNIFVMLAEERKSEMGISRAVGMMRGDLTQTFVFEGVVYAMMASLLGAFAGLVIAFFMFGAFAAVIGGELTFVLHFEWSSLALAAVGGFLITLATVVAASWRVSKLNIVRAIRDIPEPLLTRSGSKYIVLGLMALAFGVLFIFAGASSGQAAGTLSGMSLLAVGAATVSVKFVRPRAPYTLAGFWMIFYTLDPLMMDRALFGELEGNLEMFIIAGVTMVTGGVLMAMFNSDLLLGALVRAFGRGRSLLPVFRAAISYPMNKKFRTGLTLFIFALIMFTVTVIAMIASFQRESVDTLSERFSGGFEIIGSSLRDVPEDDLSTAIAEVEDDLGKAVIDRIETARTAIVQMDSDRTDESTTRYLVGMSDSILEEGRFSLAQRSDDYSSDEEAWQALLEDDGLTILDGTTVAPTMGVNFLGDWYVEVGDTVMISFAGGAAVNLTVIGMMDQMLIPGAFTSKSFVESHAPSSNENLFYIDTEPDADIKDEHIVEALEKTLAAYGLTGIVVREVVEEFMAMSSTAMQLMELFLGVGLIVGIAGLGIITIRNISERRQEIGVMRAIGYQRNMILSTFLIETSFVALLGIVMGIVLGLLISFSLFDWGGFSEYSEFVIPWGEVLLVLAIAFGVTMISTLPPSRTASKLAPAEALRRVD